MSSEGTLGSTPSLSENVMRRLALIRYLDGIAVEQSHKSEPLASLSILSFHDAVELFLQLAAEHLNVSEKRIEFERYWALLEDKLGTGQLAEKESMRRLNNARVGFKHHGTQPARQSIEGFRGSVTRFFEANTPLVFGVEFTDISLARLISYSDVRSSLVEADRLMASREYVQALSSIAQGFWLVIGEFEKWEETAYGQPFFTFREPLVSVKKPEVEPPVDPYDPFVYGGDPSGFRTRAEIADLRLEVHNRFLTVEDMLRAMSLGLDTRRYVRFRLLTSKFLDYPELTPKPVDAPPTEEVCQFCYEFVIESALKMQELAV